MNAVLTLLVAWAVISVIAGITVGTAFAWADDRADQIRRHAEEVGEGEALAFSAGRRSRRAPSIRQPSGQPGSADLM